PPSPFALLSTHTSERYPDEQFVPPNTINVFCAGSYTAAWFMREAGSVPAAVKLIQSGVPWAELASSRIHRSFRQLVELVAPPKMIMRLLLESYSPLCPKRAAGAVPEGSTCTQFVGTCET